MNHITAIQCQESRAVQAVFHSLRRRIGSSRMAANRGCDVIAGNRQTRAYYGTFKPHLLNGNPHVFRFDTRVYLHRDPDPGAGECIAAVIMMNPGAATKPSSLAYGEPGWFEGGRMLQRVRKVFLDAFRELERDPRQDEFIRIWNLFYFCCKSPREARRKVKLAKDQDLPPCPTENDRQASPRIVWFAFGRSRDRCLDPFKQRFLEGGHESPFFCDQNGEIVRNTNARPRHPRSLRSEDLERVVKHLAKEFGKI
jgi:hypothetical protein